VLALAQFWERGGAASGRRRSEVLGDLPGDRRAEDRFDLCEGDDVVIGGPGDLIFKPRKQWHTSGTPARSRHASWRSSRRPASSFFAELFDLGGVTKADPGALADLAARYELDLDPDSIPGLVERFDLLVPRRADPVTTIRHMSRLRL
jgi:hypothetical protein